MIQDAIAQRFALQQLYHDEVLAILLPDFVDGANVGMIQRGSRPRLALETFERRWVRTQYRREKLQATRRPRVTSSASSTTPMPPPSFCGMRVRDGLGVLLNNAPFCTTPPIVTVSTTPTVLWPPNGKMMPVTVSGTITDTTGCTLTSATYVVTDEYGQVEPSGPVTLGGGGAYSFTVLLQASRFGADIDGRLYTVTVRASNSANKTGSRSGTVIVPHDQGH